MEAVGGGGRVEWARHEGIVADPPDRLQSGWMAEPQLIEKTGVEASPARTRAPGREPLRIGAVQQSWHADPDEHREGLAAGIRIAAAQGARLVCLQELTLSPYF